MRCLSPLSIPRPNGRGARDRIEVPCGKCAACLSRKRQDWSFRLEQEFKDWPAAYFLTLTYSDEFLPVSDSGIPTLCKRDLQLYFKRLRHDVGTFRYYAVGEYGTNTFRPHYHAILFTDFVDVDLFTTLALNNWHQGHIFVGTVTPASIQYVTKYCITKSDYDKGVSPPFALMSRRPGLGVRYVEKNRAFQTGGDPKFYSVLPGGIRIPLSRFYRERMISKEACEHYAYMCSLGDPLDKYFEVASRMGDNPYEYEVMCKKAYSERIEKLVNKSAKI